MSKRILVKMTGDVTLPEKFIIGDWIDLRAARSYKYGVGETFCIDLGIAVKLPEGYEAHILPRSSMFKNHGIIQTNGMGIVDETYCGDDDIWMLPVYSLQPGVVEHNERICQFRIMKKMKHVEFVEVDALESPNRGGFGSSGRL